VENIARMGEKRKHYRLCRGKARGKDTARNNQDAGVADNIRMDLGEVG
jgi:hypothetical protein